jgi:hypothetical protein
LEHPEKYSTEARLILTIKKWHRQGPAYIDEQRVSIIYGEVEEVELEEFDEGYPYRRGAEIALIPKTVPVVVMVERKDNTTSPVINEATIYIFTSEGWKSVRVY